MLATAETEYVITIVLDLSGSFEQLMAEEGKGYEFAQAVIDKYFRDRIGTHDQLIIAQISAEDRALLWQGTPQELREDFPDAKSFRDFPRKKSNPNGSLVYDAIAKSVDYAMGDFNVANRRAKSAVFVLSDMEDNAPSSVQDKQRLLKVLADYGRVDGVVGFYYVDANLAGEWKRNLRATGIRQWRVESEIVQRPELPNFE